MGFEVKILAKSASPAGVVLTTMAVTYPRIIHAEMLRHRLLSRCAASSRAIPVQRFIEQVVHDPYVPEHWGANKSGMQAGDELPAEVAAASAKEWLKARDAAVDQAMRLLELGIHKQTTNRLLEPFQWMTEVITATEWSNFYHLRIHPAAHPDIQRIARMMREADEEAPTQWIDGSWHLPMTSMAGLYGEPCNKERGLSDESMKKLSVGRIARVSYLRHEDEDDIWKSIARADTMLAGGHMSPFEHVARPMGPIEISNRSTDVDVPFCGNLRGWVQYRKEIPNEADMLAPARSAG